MINTMKKSNETKDEEPFVEKDNGILKNRAIKYISIKWCLTQLQNQKKNLRRLYL